MKKPITIHDIAKIANVSSATVSRVLSNSDYPVSKALKEKIQRIAKEENYIPNLLGKQLKTNASMTLGVIIPTISNPFYSAVMLGIEEAARKKNFHVILCNSLQNPELEDEYLKTIVEKQVKGLIISSISKDKKLLKSFIRTGLNVVAMDQKIDEDNLCQIEFDYRKGGYIAAKHLIAKGHRAIGYATSALDRPSRKSICQGYCDAMAEAGLETIVEESDSEEVYQGVYEFDSGKKLAAKLMSRSVPPSAIFACNDIMAFGVINELTTRGIQVPGEVSVMGFDGIDFGQMIHPPLTTIKQPDYEMGKLACTMLLEMMSGEGGEALNLMLQPKLLERQSVSERQS